jgi:Mg2+ and Co2+ transporter CorA
VTVTRLLERVAAWLDEATMGLLALAALLLALAPAVFHFSPPTETVLDGIEWAIVLVFAVEYLVDLILAEDRRAYLTDPFRILDLVIVASPLLTLVLPSEALRATPALRLVRFARVLVFGARLHGRVRGAGSAPAAREAERPLQAVLVRADEAPLTLDGPGLLAALAPEGEAGFGAWIDASGLSAEQLAVASRAVGAPSDLLAELLHDSVSPRVELLPRATVLFLWVPGVEPDGEEAARRGAPVVGRRGLLLASTERGLLSLAREPLGLVDVVLADLAGGGPPAPLPTLALFAALRRTLRAYEQVIDALERPLRALEAAPLGDGGVVFLERTFHLRQQLATCEADLWRLRTFLEGVGAERVTLHGVPPGTLDVVRTLATDAEWVHHTASNAREALASLIELRLNVASFEMNRVMRVLAVVSVLGLVPTLAGGLLGMNLAESPWSLTLAQVSYAVASLMALLLYTFVAKGWLR